MASTDKGFRLQSGMGVKLVKKTSHTAKISKIELGRVTKVNYQNGRVGFILLTLKSDKSFSSATNTYTAMLPMSMAGRNNYGKAYGDIKPVRKGDIILVGFVDSKAYMPMVLGIYPDEEINKELTRANSKDLDPNSVYDYALANASYKVYPDQTYDFHDGYGTRILSFSGHSFIVVDAKPTSNEHLEHKTDDGNRGLDYTDLPSSYLGNKELVEPVSDKAPEIIFKHQGIVDNKGKKDTHALYLYISQDGTYRVSQMKTDEDWRTYFEIKNSKIHLVRQKNSKSFGGLDTDNLQSSEVSINEDGNVVLRNHTMGIIIEPNGIYDLAGHLLLVSENAISDLVLDKLGSLGFGGANLFSETTAAKGKYLTADNEVVDNKDALVSDYISCMGNNAYYAYAYAKDDVFPHDVTLSLAVYDSDKNFIEGKETTDTANVQIATRSLPANASYLKVSISDKSVPIMLAYGTDYSAYQPSYTDVKAQKDTVVDKADELKQDYLSAKTLASDALNDKVLALQNIGEVINDSNLSTVDKQLLKSYVDYAKDKYQYDINLAMKYEISVDDYKQAYQQLLTLMTPMLSDMATSTMVTASQIKDLWDNYFTNRCNLINRIENSSQSLYEASEKSVNNAQIQQGNSMLKQFTEVSQTLESITQATKWTVWTDDLDLDNEKVSENLLFKGNHISHSPVVGAQYIQVFSAATSRSSDAPVGVTQRVWSINSVTSYSRVLAGNTWSTWTLDSTNSDYDSELNRLTNVLSATGDTITSISNDLENTKKDINTQIGLNNTSFAEYAYSNNIRVGNVEDSITDLTKQLNTLISNYNATVKDLKTVQDSVTGLTTNYNTLLNNYNSLSDKYNDLEKRLAALENKK